MTRSFRALEDICQTAGEDVPERLKTRLREAKEERLNIFLSLREKELESFLTNSLLSSSHSALPFAGLCFAAKDVFAIERSPLSFGLKPPWEERSTVTAELIALLESKGAFCLGKTNLAPGTVSGSADNPFYGAVAHPFSSANTMYGSSAGSAAAVAHGFCDFALGSDSGGSVRAPAACCELVGFVSPQLSTAGMVSLDERIDVAGIMTRSLSDLVFVLLNMGTLKQQERQPSRKVYYPHESDWQGLSPNERKDFQSFLNSLESVFDEIAPCPVSLSFERFWKFRSFLAARAFFSLLNSHGYREEDLPPEGHAVYLFGQELAHSWDEETALAELAEQEEFLKDSGRVLITPVLATGALLSKTAVNHYLPLVNVLQLSALSWRPPWATIPIQIAGDTVEQLAACADVLNK